MERLPRSNTYSQYGEDGLVAALISRIPLPRRFCVEFGAWDGRNLSNTFNLVSNSGWRALYIEADPVRFRDLQRTAQEIPRITPVCSLVTATGDTSLDAILRRHDVPDDFELLSIDVDGADYDIWEATTARPSIVIIEHNETMPPGFEFVDRGGAGFVGSSATSLWKLARSKGYSLVDCTRTNSVYLRDDILPATGLSATTVAEAFDTNLVCHLFLNFAGEPVLSNAAVAQQFRGISYTSAAKRIKHGLLREPSFHVLGAERPPEGFATRLLRRFTGAGKRRRRSTRR